jgi:hypothetical protein
VQIKFGSLLKEHDADIRVIPVASFREIFHWVPEPTWQSWRTRAGVPARVRLMSRLSALQLWAIARVDGAINRNQVGLAVAKMVEEDPLRVADWLRSYEWSTKARTIAYSASEALRSVMGAINMLAPQVDVIHRQRLYEWFKRAGLKYSTRRSYQRYEILRVVAVAVRGVGRGGPRRNAAFF